MEAAMTLSETVSSIAQEAASTASEIGSQALGLGSKAAELGSDAASTVASAAEHLADSLSKRANHRKRHPVRWILLVGAATAGVIVFVNSRKRSSTYTATPEERRADEPTPVGLLG
jgi:hypothetical protein